MSVAYDLAYDFAPSASGPVRARAAAPVPVEPDPIGPVPVRPVPLLPEPSAPRRLAGVAVLHPPAAERPAVRLTRRGVVVLGIAVALLAGGLVWLARLSAPQATAPRTAAHVVVVQPGDTLWAIATRAAPNSDPQAEVERLMRRNHLTDAGGLRPGMHLQVP